MFKILTKALILKNNKLLILKRKESSKFAGGLWDIPGGKLEFGENLEDSLKREIYEETTLKVNVKKVLNVASSVDIKTENQYITIVYICEYESGNVQLDGENTNYEWAPLDSLKEFEKIYYLNDAITMIANEMPA